MAYVPVRAWFHGRLVELAVPASLLNKVAKYVGTYARGSRVSGWWTQDTGSDAAAHELLALPGVFISHRWPRKEVGR